MSASLRPDEPLLALLNLGKAKLLASCQPGKVSPQAPTSSESRWRFCFSRACDQTDAFIQMT